MRRNLCTFALTLLVLWLATFVSHQFSVGVAVGAAYVAALMLFADHTPRPAPNSGGEDA